MDQSHTDCLLSPEAVRKSPFTSVPPFVERSDFPFFFCLLFFFP